MTTIDPNSEAYVQSLVRLEAPRAGVRLFRNNVGMLRNDEGQPVRFGLANESAPVNRELKSGDLIGWRKLVIDIDMLIAAGGVITVAQIVSRECKRPDWTPAPPPPPGWLPAHGGHKLFLREEAQRRWAALVNADGGDAEFCLGEGTL